MMVERFSAKQFPGAMYKGEDKERVQWIKICKFPTKNITEKIKFDTRDEILL